jgi:hypothetical protein
MIDFFHIYHLLFTKRCKYMVILINYLLSTCSTDSVVSFQHKKKRKRLKARTTVIRDLENSGEFSSGGDGTPGTIVYLCVCVPKLGHSTYILQIIE